MKNILILVAVILVVGFGVGYKSIFADEEVTKRPETAAEPLPENKDLLVKLANSDMLKEVLPYDVTYGDRGAPVTIVEYASLSCHHCRDFHEDTFKIIKEQYIETGKVHFIYRHYPLNMPAFRAAQLVSCIEDDSKKKRFMNALFATQKDWSQVKNDEELQKNLGDAWKIAGYSSDKYTSCISNKEMEDKLLQMQMEASKALQVNSTPSIYVNGDKYTGKRDPDSFVPFIRGYFNGNAPKAAEPQAAE